MSPEWCAVILIVLVPGGFPQMYRWECSSADETGRYYLPAFDEDNSRAILIGIATGNFESSIEDRTYIYPITSSQVNCSGVVGAVEFCYRATDNDYGRDLTIFHLSVLQGAANTNDFTVAKSFDVTSTPSRDKCTDSPISPNTYCCDKVSIGTQNQFQIAAPNLAYGVTLLSSTNPNLVRWSEGRYPQYTVGHYTSSDSPSIGEVYRFDSNELVVTEAHHLLRFAITPLPATTTTPQPFPTTTAQTSTSVVPEIPPTLNNVVSPVVTEATTSPSSPVGSQSQTPTLLLSTSNESVETSSGSSLATTFSLTTAGNETTLVLESPSSIIIVAGVVAAAVVVLCLVVFIVVAAAVAHRRARIRKLKLQNGRSCGFTIDNELYKCGIDVKSDYRKQEIKEVEYDYTDVDAPTLSGTARTLEPAAYETFPEYHNGPVVMKKEKSEENLYESPLPQVPKESFKKEQIYMAPAADEKHLYVQLEEIMTSQDAVTRSNIKMGDLLGSGQFGNVYRGILQCSNTSIDVAIKTLKNGSTKGDRIKFLQEAAIMGQFRHPNVVTMHGVVTDREPVLLVLEMLEKGDLRQYLLSLRSKEDFHVLGTHVGGNSLLGFCRQIASGMSYLSSISFVHRDLAARNILLSGDYICKIADFGMSRDLDDENYYHSKGSDKIPLKWTAPEAIHYKKYSTASDVWSFGIVLYEIWSIGHKPYEGLTTQNVLQLLESDFRLAPPPGCPRNVYSIMMSCWHPKAKKRPTFSELHAKFSVPDFQLLHCSYNDDQSTPKDAARLGANIKYSEKLYRDLQFKYTSNDMVESVYDKVTF